MTRHSANGDRGRGVFRGNSQDLMAQNSKSGGRGQGSAIGNNQDFMTHHSASNGRGRGILLGNNQDFMTQSSTSSGMGRGRGLGNNQDFMDQDSTSGGRGRGSVPRNYQDFMPHNSTTGGKGRGSVPDFMPPKSTTAGGGRGRGSVPDFMPPNSTTAGGGRGRGSVPGFIAHSSTSSGRGRGCVFGSGQGSIAQSYSEHDSSSDDDDESVAHNVARRGPDAQVQIPDPINREWIFVNYGEFSNQTKATRIIKSILQAMWSGPWETWKSVSREDRDRLFERFQGYFQWENHWDAQIHGCWERINARKVRDLLKRARKGAIAMANKKSLEVGDDFSVLLEFKPPWMRTVFWNKLIEVWNTPSWKAKSRRNTENRAKSTCCHTLGSQSFVTAKIRADKILGREISFDEMWKQSHCKKGSRPLDKVFEGSSLVVDGLGEGFSSEENIQVHVEWVDVRSCQTHEKYEAYFMEKYEEGLINPRFDEGLWSRASGGKNKGKLYGFNNVDDPSALINGIPSTSCSSTSHGSGIQDTEIQRLKGIIEGLVAEKEIEKAEKQSEKAEKEREKTEKESMHERLTTIEAMLKLVLQNLPSSS